MGSLLSNQTKNQPQQQFNFRKERKKARAKRFKRMNMGSDNNQKIHFGDGAENCLNGHTHLGDIHKHFKIPRSKPSRDVLNDIKKILTDTVRRNEELALHFLFAITLSVIDRIEEIRLPPYFVEIFKGPTEFVRHLRFLKQVKSLTCKDLWIALRAMRTINTETVEV